MILQASCLQKIGHADAESFRQTKLENRVSLAQRAHSHRGGPNTVKSVSLSTSL